MTRDSLVEQIRQKRSFLCIGLDTDLRKVPSFLHSYADPVFEFNRRIIDATRDLCVAYKPNIAFYEALGAAGWQSLARTMEYLGDEHFTIADAKRGDIGNTSKLYARAFFEQMNFDAVTVAPYMGEDSVTPFLEFPGKWVILLALTSNRGSSDFQLSEDPAGTPLFERVMRRACEWAGPDRLMFVTGATHPERMAQLRTIAPDNFFLVPGVGAQGGSLSEVAEHGRNAEIGLLVNSSRGIIYAGQGEDFAEKAREAAGEVQREMAAYFTGK
ncbi:MAG: orotidine-5'-phosphate decarboxylase [Saprospiraceae bacterium]|nr:orotidine-5'-phosphate decarboxylase [Saprospiraceae bacterium]MCB0623111.1 orotidine-5'-phosphate decarboxylase [Saprospiraceae bacterium]MCB0677973.1 orotidine-5'-phosphate decarboxylase [Saprospiraceae bacterium]MCB0683266.1 orotidine-5'-phosphate decarboxylase [Saprospiraceae bacterium]